MIELPRETAAALALAVLVLMLVLILSIRKVRRILMVAEEKANAPITSDLNRPAPSDRNVGHDWSPAYRACRNCNMPRSQFIVSFAPCPGEVDEEEQLARHDTVASNDLNRPSPEQPLAHFSERGSFLSFRERGEPGPTISMNPDRAAAIRNGSHYWQPYQKEPNTPAVMRCNICGIFQEDWIRPGLLGPCPGRRTA